MAAYRKMSNHKKNADLKGIKHKELDSIRTLLNNGNLKTASSEIIKFLDKYPGDVYGHYLYGKILIQNNDLQSAKKEFQKVVDARGKNRPNALNYLGKIAELEQDYNLARRYYRQAMTEKPEQEENFSAMSLARIEKETGYYGEALKILYSLNPKTPEIKLEIAKNLTALERDREAEKILARLVPQNKQQEREIAVEKGKIYKARYEYDRALACYEVAKDTDQKDKIYYQAVMEQARIAKVTNNYEMLVTYCEELYSAGKTFNGTVIVSLGIGKLGIGAYQSAKQLFEMALGVNDHASRGAAAYYLSSLQILEDREDLAEKTLKDNIETSELPTRLVYLKLIKLLYLQARYDEAEDYLSKMESQYDYLDDDYAFRGIKLLLDKAQKRQLPPREDINYFEKQIVSYNRDDALSQIKESHTGTQDGKSCFSPNINIDDLFIEVTSQLTEENKLSLVVSDEYEILYQNAGYRNGDIYHKIRIVTLPGTKQIITMYPCEAAYLPTKQNYTQELAKEKSKANDRISRFNARFAKFQNQ